LSAVRALLFTSDSQSLVSGSYDGAVRKWDVGTGAEVWSRCTTAGNVLSIGELGDGRLVVAAQDGSVRVMDPAAGLEIMACRGHTDWVPAVTCLGDCSFASGSDDRTVRVWAGDGGLVRVVEVGAEVGSLCLSPCDQLVAAGCGNGCVKLYALPEWDEVWSVKAHRAGVFSVSWSGRLLASGSYDEKVKLLCADTGATLRTLGGHTMAVMAVLFTGDGTQLLSGSLDGTVSAWRVFCAEESRVKGLFSALEVGEDWETSEVCLEVVGRMKRLWLVEREA
jgi:WD40 repeat protein